MNHRFLLFTVFLILSLGSAAQYYDTGQDPSSLKWMQIKTDHFTVIYPEKYGAGGLTYAKSLDEAYSKMISLFPEKKFKIPVVIHNYTTMSNGYVAWAPRRMELYPTPEQNGIPLDPVEQLAIHELTHVFQMESLNRGFTKAMSIFLGEQFTGIVASLLPQWLLEGDAVFAESVLTESGRGRVPSFQKQLKAISVEKVRLYKYDKILNGSYRDFVPDRYQSGYQMVTWAMTKHDPQIWNKVLNFTGKEPFTLNPVNISLSKSAGLTKKRLYNEAFDSLNIIWKKEVTDNNSLSYETINPSRKEKYINYSSPVFAGRDSVVAVKTSLSDPAVFVLINPAEKTEKKIHTPGQLYPLFISYANGKIVWVETQYDKRWENREYSVIKILDIKSKKTTSLSRKSRYLAASISPDGRQIAAIENTIKNINNIVLIDAETAGMKRKNRFRKNRNILQSVSTPGNAWLQHPQWSDRGDKITVISLTEAGEGIMSYTLADQKWETLVEAGRDDLQSALLRNDSLFYISSLSGTDNIYLRTSDKETKSLTNSKFGVIDLSLSGEKVFFSDYTSTGNNICSIALAQTPGKVFENKASSTFLINRFDLKPTSFAPGDGKVYTPEPYRKWQHLFNFHSWMPFYADIKTVQTDPASIRPGITIMSQNNLSTLISTIGYEYSADKRHLLHTRVTWKGWYPEIESQLDYGYLPVISKPAVTDPDPLTIQPGMRFINTVSLPLTFNSGKFTQYLYPSFTSDYSNNYIFLAENNLYDNGQTQLTARLYFSNYHRSAIRDIYPRWAQIIDYNYTFSPFDKEINGSANSIKTAFYFPGFFSNNSVKIRFEKEKQKIARFYMGNMIHWPRSYQNIYSRDLNFFSLDYTVPLFYPDFNISGFLYLKRIRADLFYDFARGKGNAQFNQTDTGLTLDYDHDYFENFKSFGFELLTDFHLLRNPFMISAGAQCAWQDISKTPFLKLLFNIDIFGMSIGKSGL